MAESAWIQDWLILNESLAGEWCRQTEARLRAVLGFDFGIGLKLPTQGEAERCSRVNTTLQGTLALSAGGASVEIHLPLPFDGVFSLAGESGTIQTLVWENWMAERPGIRHVSMRHEGEGNEKKSQLWLVFPDGSHLAVPLRPPKKAGELLDRAKSLLRRIPFGPLWTEADYPQGWLRDALRKASQKMGAAAKIDNRGRRDVAQGEAAGELMAELRAHADDFPDETDSDDLERRALTTFPRWLVFRLCQYLAKTVQEDDDARSLIRRLRDRKPENIGEGILPVRLLARRGELVRVAPVNAVELMARLTGVRRYRFRRETAALVPAEMRQNHPSFEGRICPLESPESELVGLQLQLARGARVDADGAILPASPECPIDCLGWGAALIPFAHHNDGARDMMGAKNLRQAVPVAGREAPAVATGAEASLAERVRRLSAIGFCPDCSDGAGGLALGCDLLAAYMPWDGWNVDDAVVIGRSAALKLGIAETRTWSRELAPDMSCEVADGMKKGSVLKTGDVVATLKSPGGRKTQLVYRDVNPAKIVRPPKPFDGESGKKTTHHLFFSFEETLPLGPGDKLMGRHGNKGVVARVLDDSKMPRLPDDPRLPEPVRGKPVDIVLNPHGVLSRMSPGQLLETHLGWLLHAGVGEAELLADGSPERAVGDLSARIDHGKIRRLLEETGLDRSGAIRLLLPCGGGGAACETEQPVVVGYQHFVRLHHVPSLKAQARRGGDRAAYSPATRQAAHGRRIGGGQRIGEMEIWALAAHGAYAILGEMLGVKSDALLARGDASGARGFKALLDDWLLALCAQCEIGGREARSSPLADRAARFAKMGLPEDGSTGKVVNGDFPKDGRKPKPGTLFDEAIFGKGGVDDDKWGYIELPCAVPHPWNPDVEITVVPVLPLRYRLMRRDRSNPADPGRKINLAYKRLVEAANCKTGKGKRPESEEKANGEGWQKKWISCCLRTLFDILLDRFRGKEGLFRHEGLGRRVDRSFRLVIAPDPTLEWNQAGIPADILWELLGDRIKEWFRERPPERRGIGAIARAFGADAKEGSVDGDTAADDGGNLPLQIGNAIPGGIGVGFSWRYTDLPADTFGVAVDGVYDPRGMATLDGPGVRELVNRYLAAHPDTLVVLNRQPSLHKYSFQAFHPVATDPREGEVLRIPPLCCKGFAADFDGDEMVGHIPLSREAQAEAQRLLPENNLCSVANGEPLLNLDRDLVTGIATIREGIRHDRGNLHETELPPCCREILAAADDADKKAGEALVEHISKVHPGASAIRIAGELARLAWRTLARGGFSFGFYDLLDLSERIGSYIARAKNNEDMKNRVEKRFGKVLKDELVPSGSRAVATMILSDANGKKQIPQIIARRGKLEGLAKPGGSIKSSLVGGMSWKELFKASWNARRSMCDKKLGTAKGGDLTRKLVFALWPLGPQGLVAAQSIGERGTQLPMRTFHAGKREFDIDQARMLFLKNKAPNDGNGSAESSNDKDGAAETPNDKDGANAFITKVQSFDEYKKIDPVHFQILWEALKKAGEKSLDSAIGSSGSAFAWLLLQQQYKRLKELIANGKSISLDSPFAKVLFNGFASQDPEAGKED